MIDPNNPNKLPSQASTIWYTGKLNAHSPNARWTQKTQLSLMFTPVTTRTKSQRPYQDDVNHVRRLLMLARPKSRIGNSYTYLHHYNLGESLHFLNELQNPSIYPYPLQVQKIRAIRKHHIHAQPLFIQLQNVRQAPSTR